jgi:hypothetical protein
MEHATQCDDCHRERSENSSVLATHVQTALPLNLP